MEKNSILQAKNVCRIISLGVNPDVSRRLSQMGILPGMEVTIARIGPLGGPLELAMKSGHSIALRREEARALECEVVAFPLSVVKAGPETYRIRELQGGIGFQRRMTDLGAAVGAELRVVEGRPCRFLLLPDGPRVTIGRGEAGKILLAPSEKNPYHA